MTITRAERDQLGDVLQAGGTFFLTGVLAIRGLAFPVRVDLNISRKRSNAKVKRVLFLGSPLNDQGLAEQFLGLIHGHADPAGKA